LFTTELPKFYNMDHSREMCDMSQSSSSGIASVGVPERIYIVADSVVTYFGPASIDTYDGGKDCDVYGEFTVLKFTSLILL
jgi:hypothetical protein